MPNHGYCRRNRQDPRTATNALPGGQGRSPATLPRAPRQGPPQGRPGAGVAAGARQPRRGRHRPADHRAGRALWRGQAARRARGGPPSRRLPPLPARRAFIPKPGRGERRPLSIPAVRDRIVQAAVKIVIEPIFEADFQPCSFGFRPQAGGARCPPGSDRRVLAGQAVGRGDGHRLVFRGDPARAVDAGDRGADLRPQAPAAAARDVARGGDGGGRGQAQRHRHPAGRGDLACCSPTSTSTGSTGSGRRAAAACWCATPTIWW